MKFQKDISHKKPLFVGSILGIFQLFYIIVLLTTADWEKISDPLLHSIVYFVLLPFSIFLFFMSIIAGYLYPKANYTKPIKYALLISFIISFLIALGIYFSGASSFSDILGHILGIFIISSPVLLSISLLLGKWEVMD